VPVRKTQTQGRDRDRDRDRDRGLPTAEGRYQLRGALPMRIIWRHEPCLLWVGWGGEERLFSSEGSLSFAAWPTPLFIPLATHSRDGAGCMQEQEQEGKGKWEAEDPLRP